MSQANVETLQRGLAAFQETGDFLEELVHPEFVWDMSHLDAWPEQRFYAGLEGARKFLADWTEGWDDWEFEVTALHDGGDKVVAICHQHARSRLTGLPVEMDFAQVWTLRDGLMVRMEMYIDVAAAFESAGLPAG